MVKMKTTFFYFVLLTGYVSCCASMSYSGTTASSFFETNNLWHSISAAITGAVLSSSSFIFFIRRLVGQYDDRHSKSEKEITSLQEFQKNLDITLFSKLHEQTEDIRQDLQKLNETSTTLILSTINDVKDELHSMVTDVALLKDDRKRCYNITERIDQNSNDITVVAVKYDSLASNVNKLEKQVDRHISNERHK